MRQQTGAAGLIRSPTVDSTGVCSSPGLASGYSSWIAAARSRSCLGLVLCLALLGSWFARVDKEDAATAESPLAATSNTAKADPGNRPGPAQRSQGWRHRFLPSTDWPGRVSRPRHRRRDSPAHSRIHRGVHATPTARTARTAANLTLVSEQGRSLRVSRTAHRHWDDFLRWRVATSASISALCASRRTSQLKKY